MRGKIEGLSSSSEQPRSQSSDISGVYGPGSDTVGKSDKRSVDVRSTVRETCFRYLSCHTLSSSAMLLTFMSCSATYVSVKGRMDSL